MPIVRFLLATNSHLANYGPRAHERIRQLLEDEYAAAQEHTLQGAGLWTWSSWSANSRMTSVSRRLENMASLGGLLTTRGTSWRIDSDRSMLQPIFVLISGQRIQAVSSEPALLAALENTRLNPLSLMQDIVFGYRVGRLSIFDQVERLNSDDVLLASSSSGSANIRITKNNKKARANNITDNTMISSMIDTVEKMFASGAALELTGGVDSRLVLAFGLAVGCKPEIAMTIGNERAGDILAARRICAEFGISHHVVEVSPDNNMDIGDAIEFVEGSGFSANASEYGWLPSVFKTIKGLRTSQISGVGGESATGFYYTPFDRLFETHLNWPIWIKTRLEAPGNRGSDVFVRKQYQRLWKQSERAVCEILSIGGDSWREKTDRLYTAHRLRQWGGPALAASSGWYNVAAPFLSQVYLDWAESLLPEQKYKRRRQLAVLRSVGNDLADLPFSCNYKSRSSSRHIKRVLKVLPGCEKWGRVNAQQQVFNGKANRTSAALLATRGVRERLVEFADEHSTWLNPRNVEQLANMPEYYPRELGALMTAKWAQARKVALANNLSASTETGHNVR